MRDQNKFFFIKGSGFKSITIALALRKKFPKSKIILEKNLLFGGVYSSIKYNSFFLDIGCHLFDLTDKMFLDLFEINHKNIIPIDLKYKSVNKFGYTNGYAIYDFRNHKNIKILQQSFFKNLENKTTKIKNLYDRYYNHFGPQITKLINKFCLKITGKSLKQIHMHSNEFFMFDRILLFNTRYSLKLKQEGLEKYLATPSKYNHDYSNGKIVFTFKSGAFGFIKHVLNLFKKKNITFQNKIASKKLKIINPITNSKILRENVIDIPLHIIYLKCKKFPYTYFHDYTDSPIFRVSSPGFYSNQLVKNYSYICIEVPDPKMQYNKKFLINYTIKYIKKYCKSEYLHYIFSKKSYPTIYKKIISNKKYKLDPFVYPKKKLVKNIIEYVDEI